MKLSIGSIILLSMIFGSVVTGYLVVRTTYKKKNADNYMKRETSLSLEYGNITFERFYRNGMNVKAFGYYKDGTLKSEYYITDNSGNSSKYISYYPNKQVEVRSMKWIEGDSSHFEYEEFFENGTIRRREGSKLPKWEYYDENGEPMVLYYRNGSKITEVMYFHGNKKQDESEYVDGVREGKWMQWDSTGKQIRNELYNKGLKLN